PFSSRMINNRADKCRLLCYFSETDRMSSTLEKLLHQRLRNPWDSEVPFRIFSLGPTDHDFDDELFDSLDASERRRIYPELPALSGEYAVKILQHRIQVESDDQCREVAEQVLSLAISTPGKGERRPLPHKSV